LVLGWDFRGRRIEHSNGAISGGIRPLFCKFTRLCLWNALYPIHVMYMYTDHTLPSDSIMTVDGYDRRVDWTLISQQMVTSRPKV